MATTPTYGPGSGIDYNGYKDAFSGAINNYINNGQNTVNNTANTDKSAFTDMMGGQKQDIGTFSNDFRGAIPSLYQQGNSMFNVQGLQSTANALGDRISTLQNNSDFSGTGGYNSADQVDKAVQTNYLPRYQQAQTNAQNAENLAQGYVTSGMAPYTTEAGLINNYQGNLATGMTAEDGQRMQALQTVLEQGGQLTADEYNQLSALQQKQADYNQAQMGAMYAYNSSANRYLSVPPSNKLIDTQNMGNLSLGGLAAYKKK